MWRTWKHLKRGPAAAHHTHSPGASGQEHWLMSHSTAFKGRWLPCRFSCSIDVWLTATPLEWTTVYPPPAEKKRYTESTGEKNWCLYNNGLFQPRSNDQKINCFSLRLSDYKLASKHHLLHIAEQHIQPKLTPSSARLTYIIHSTYPYITQILHQIWPPPIPLKTPYIKKHTSQQYTVVLIQTTEDI